MQHKDMNFRTQKVLLYWGWAFMAIFGAVLWGLLKMMPPPSAALSAVDVAAFYTQNSLDIRIGAMIASWTSAFTIPLYVVIATQMWRLEKGVPILTMLQMAGGVMMSIFLVLPPLFWGVAAFTPERMPEITALMHELGCLTLVTTDQYFIFQMVPMAYMCLTNKDPLSPFPRWLGYMTIWAAVIFEVGALGFIPKTGPFAWDGLFVYWFPLCTFGIWMTSTIVVMLGAINRQQAAAAQAQ